MDIEKLATSAVTTSIATTDVLSSFINEGDKEPSWDGNIYIYSNKTKKKDGLKKVPVQIKGTQREVHPSTAITYPISTAHLDNWCRDGGVMLFVVYIDKTGLRKTIYYSGLLPVKIRNILEKSHGAKMPKIELKPFPEDNESKVSVLLNFYENKQRQASFANVDLLSFEQLEQTDNLESISFPFTTYGKQNVDPMAIIFQDDLYMYANIKGSTIPQPIFEMPIRIQISEIISNAVSVNGTPYYPSFCRMHSKEKTTLLIGKSLEITVMNGAESINIKCMPTSKLKEIIVDYIFLLAMYKHQHFQIGTLKIPLDTEKMFTSEKVSALEQRLDFCKKLSKVVEYLRLDNNIDIATLSGEDIARTNQFYTGLIMQENVSGLRDDLPPISKVCYLGTKVVIGFLKSDQDPNTYMLSDYFQQPVGVFFEDEDGKHRTSQFIILKAEDYLEIGNVDYDAITQSFQGLESERFIYGRANSTLLEMLSAYDKSGDSRPEILAGAAKLADWLFRANVPTEELNLAIRTLNYYQVLKRQGKLTAEQLKQIAAIAEDEIQTEAVRTGANLLLGNQYAAEIHFERIEENERDEFRNYPIYRFWEKDEKTYI